MAMEPRCERCFSVHDVAAALQKVAARRGACEASDVLRALCELFPACSTEGELLAEVQRALEEGVMLGIVARVGNRYRPAGFPGMHGLPPAGGGGGGGYSKGFVQHSFFAPQPPEG